MGGPRTQHPWSADTHAGLDARCLPLPSTLVPTAPGSVSALAGKDSSTSLPLKAEGLTMGAGPHPGGLLGLS